MHDPMEAPIVAEALKGNADALAFVRAIALVLHTWDDLVDRDHDVDDAAINRAFWLALVELPRNAFYREHFNDLNAILVNAIVNWRIATNVERLRAPPAGDLMIAFIIRSTYVDLLTVSATLIGGADWSVTFGGDIHRWAHGEGFAAYLTNLTAEKAAREANYVL
jgi:hypothetical protein